MNGETSDGVSGNVGSIFVANTVLIAEGRRADLIVSLVDTAASDHQVAISYGSPQVTDTVTVGGHGVTQRGEAGHQRVILTVVDLRPGSLFRSRSVTTRTTCVFECRFSPTRSLNTGASDPEWLLDRPT
jgi:hypothetical protein